MDAKKVQRRLAQAILVANPSASVLETKNYVHAGSLTIEVGADRLMVGPSATKLTADQVRVLGDPESILWFVARFDDPDFAGRVARFLNKRGVGLPADWLD